ncbi:uncharacterized protein C20orf141 homolog [Choloepus didactylus]|uniref:uncharacterized protein C20orf141 homolog n=1 Tax=Choloepus didactylus TaxID=27675 RepID=UPI00189E7652|nr:uncharacterized protein C20orf141 homolog [Choloepus didactylus]
MTQLCLPRPEVLTNLIPVPPRVLGAGEGLGSPAGPSMTPWDPRPVQLLDSTLGLGALGLTVWAVFSAAGPALLLLLLLLISFLAFDLLHRPAMSSLLQHRLLEGGQIQGAGEGPGQLGILLLSNEAATGQISLQDALLLLLMGLGLLLGAQGMPLALLGLVFCLHPWV